jgi:hypothetical protein
VNECAKCLFERQSEAASVETEQQEGVSDKCLRDNQVQVAS